MADLLAEFIGECPAIRAVRDQARRMLASEQPNKPLPSILIDGGAGTGKSRLAWLIHRSGSRADYPFVSIDCESVPEVLLDAELFGFAPGPERIRYPLGKRGLVEAAHRGTLFLDGIEFLPIGSQIRLEWVLETRQNAPRIGESGNEARARGDVDVRLISATRTNMSVEIEQGRFRKNLYDRLADVTFTLPPLYMRKGDVVLFAERLLVRTCRAAGIPVKRLAPDAKARLQRRFFGEVRELAGLIERITLLTTEPVVTAEMLAAVGLPEDRASD